MNPEAKLNFKELAKFKNVTASPAFCHLSLIWLVTVTRLLSRRISWGMVARQLLRKPAGKAEKKADRMIISGCFYRSGAKQSLTASQPSFTIEALGWRFNPNSEKRRDGAGAGADWNLRRDRGI